MEILAVRSRDEFHREVVRFAGGLGFDTVSATVGADQPGGTTSFDSVHNTPSKYLSIFADRGQCQRDPVMQHCKCCSVPIVWANLPMF